MQAANDVVHARFVTQDDRLYLELKTPDGKPYYTGPFDDPASATTAVAISMCRLRTKLDAMDRAKGNRGVVYRFQVVEGGSLH